MSHPYDEWDEQGGDHGAAELAHSQPYDDDLAQQPSMIRDSVVDKALTILAADSFRLGGSLSRADVDRVGSLLQLSSLEVLLLEERCVADEIIEPDDDEQSPVISPGSVNTIDQFLHEVGRYELLTAEDEARLSQAIEGGVGARTTLSSIDHAAMTKDTKERLLDREQRGLAAKMQLVCSNLRLVISIAKRYRGQGLPLEDLIQEGVFGLIRAAELFDWRKGFKFSTYATWWIRQAVTRGVANTGRTIRLPVHVVDDLRRLANKEQDFVIKVGRPPTVEELAQQLDMSEDKIRGLLQTRSLGPVSLDVEISDDADGATLADRLPNASTGPAEETLNRARNETLFAMVGALPARERDILVARYGLAGRDELTLEEIGKGLGITRERVRQLETIALESLRKDGRLSSEDAEEAR